MTENEKIFAAGCAAGATVAAIPAAYALSQNMKKRPLGEHDFVRAENGGFVTECGERIIFKGINLNDDILNFQKWDLPAKSRTVSSSWMAVRSSKPQNRRNSSPTRKATARKTFYPKYSTINGFPV